MIDTYTDNNHRVHRSVFWWYPRVDRNVVRRAHYKKMHHSHTNGWSRQSRRNSNRGRTHPTLKDTTDDAPKVLAELEPRYPPEIANSRMAVTPPTNMVQRFFCVCFVSASSGPNEKEGGEAVLSSSCWVRF